MQALVMAEGRRMMRRARELDAEVFAALLAAYERLLRAAFARAGGREVEVDDDTATAVFDTPGQAARAALAVQRAVSTHDWPHALDQHVSIGIAPAGASELAAVLCDAADAGQIFVAAEIGERLSGEAVADAVVLDRDERRTRRSGEVVVAYEIVRAPDADG